MYADMQLEVLETFIINREMSSKTHTQKLSHSFTVSFQLHFPVHLPIIILKLLRQKNVHLYGTRKLEYTVLTTQHTSISCETFKIRIHSTDNTAHTHQL
jgi:hypothetical protein